MEEIRKLIEELKAAGITPQVQVHLPVENADEGTLKALAASLKGAGLAPEVHLDIHVTLGEAPSAQPVTAETLENSMAVMVAEDKLNCLTFFKRDQAGKPIMDFPKPRVQLFRGDRLRVSTTHKVSEKDPGDGTVIATGGIRYYWIVDCPSKREAEGLYIKQSDVTAV